jgi:hypothetical protein
LANDDDRALKGQILNIAGDVSLGIGAFVGILSLYYFLRDPLPDSEAEVGAAQDWALLPRFGPRGGGAQLRWSF